MDYLRIRWARQPLLCTSTDSVLPEHGNCRCGLQHLIHLFHHDAPKLGGNAYQPMTRSGTASTP